MVDSCTVCLNNLKKNKNVLLFMYPIYPLRRYHWLKAVGRLDLLERINRNREGYRICEDHFEKRFIKTTKNFTCLYSDAFPTLNLPCQNEETPSTSSAEPQSNESGQQYSGNANVSEETNLVQSSEEHFQNVTIKAENSFIVNGSSFYEEQNTVSSIQECQENNSKNDRHDDKEDFLGLCDKFLNKGMTQMIKWQMGHHTGVGAQNTSSILFALNLYFMSPEAYKFLRSTFGLPSFDMLQSTVIPKSTKIDDRILRVLQMKVEKMSPQEKICTACVEYRPIRQNLFYDIKNDNIIGFNEIQGLQRAEPAKYAIVIIVRGITHKWKQPIVHSFLSHCRNDPEVKVWIYEILFQLIEIGFDIRAFVTNLDTHFTGPSMSSSLNADTTFFYIGGHKIYYIFDILNLINRLVNIFQTYHIIYDMKIAKWSDIMNMQKHDEKSDGTSTFMNRQSKRNSFQGTGMNLATDVFNNVIGRKIKKCVKMKVMDENSLDTADFVMKMSLLYQILNSSTPQSFTNNDNRLKFLKDILPLFEDMNVVTIDTFDSVTKQMPSITGFRVTLKSILQLIEDLQSADIPKLSTECLTISVMDNFFGKIRQENKKYQRPTCRQVSKAFKKSFVYSLLRKLDAPNCNKDFISLLANQEDPSYFDDLTKKDDDHNVTITVGTVDYRLDVPENNALVYVSVFLFRQCITKHKCNILAATLDKYVNGNKVESDLLIVPPVCFISTVKLLDEKFCEYFALGSAITNVGNDILRHYSKCSFELPCPCFPIKYLMQLFCRFKIYQTLKRNNKLFKSNEDQLDFVVTMF